MEPARNDGSNYNFEKIVDILIRLFVLMLLLGWCFDILRPFVFILIWAMVIAISMFPAYNSMAKLFRGKKILAAMVITLLMLSVLVIPSWLITESLINGIGHLREIYQNGDLLIPPPPESTNSWPAIAKPVIELWQLASTNLQEATLQYKDSIIAAGTWLVNAFAGLGKGVLQFVLSIIIAGVLMYYSESETITAKKIFKKLAGENGENFAAIAVGTIRSVVKGILGVAVIQTTMAGLGFFIAGVPYAGLWTVLSLGFAIIQLGVGPVAIPVCIYMFSVASPMTATLLTIWMVIVLISDNILKPLLLGRGAVVPMLVVFLGAIGGFMYSGFLGLFLGALILTIGYKLFLAWLDTENGN